MACTVSQLSGDFQQQSSLYKPTSVANGHLITCEHLTGNKNKAKADPRTLGSGTLVIS